MRSCSLFVLLLATAQVVTALPVPARIPWSNRQRQLNSVAVPLSTSVGATPENHNTKGPWRLLRGGGRLGGCGDTNAQVALKAAITATLETIGLMGVIAGAKMAAKKYSIPLLSKVVNGLPVIQWASLVFVIFSPSTIKNMIEGGVSAASNQVLNPSAVPGQGEWYANLKKPLFNPPGWLFPIMWLIVSKPTQMIAVSKILKAVDPAPWWPALTVYCAHLSLGDAWNDVFFGCERIGLGAGVISTFYGMLLTSAKLFGDLNGDAGLFMLPTCGWVTVATALNLAIYRLNPGEVEDKTD
jgi:benzodiazapine receptor